MEPSRAEVQVWYERYLARCNAHAFDDLGEFVAGDVGGAADGLERYVAGLRAVVEGFADYRWELQRLLVDGAWLAARLVGSGTHTGPFEGVLPTGRRVRTQELVMYRLVDGRIADCWGDLATTVRNALTRPAP